MNDLNTKLCWEYLHAKNSIIYNENEVARRAKQNNDDELNKIVPYMSDYYPILTFTTAESSVPLPHFYEDYPILVSDEVYKAGLTDDYQTVLKIWEEGAEVVQLTPEDSPHKIRADIQKIKAYVYSCKDWGEEAQTGTTSFEVEGEQIDISLGWLGSVLATGQKNAYGKEIADLDEDDFEYDIETGKITLDYDVSQDLKQALYDRYSKVYPDYKVFIVLEIRFDKYASVNDFKNLTSEELTQIATMQSLQANLMEYYYQFQVATQTQQALNELAYTIAVTVLSTGITSLGTRQGLQKTLSNIKEEVLEEVFLDPTLEAISGGITRQYTDDIYTELLVTTLVESIRESTSAMGYYYNNRLQQKASIRYQQNLIRHTQVDTMQDMNEIDNMMQEMDEDIEKISDPALLSAIMFTGAMLGLKAQFDGYLGDLQSALGAVIDADPQVNRKAFYEAIIKARKKYVEGLFFTMAPRYVYGDMSSGLGESYNDIDLGEAAFYGMPIPQGIIENLAENVYEIQDQRTPKAAVSIIEQILDEKGITYMELWEEAKNNKGLEQLLKAAEFKASFAVASGNQKKRRTFVDKFPRDDYVKFYFDRYPDILTGKKINKYTESNKRLFEGTCVNLALRLENLLLRNYASDILKSDQTVYQMFDFRLDKAINDVVNRRQKTIGVKMLERVKLKILKEYNSYKGAISKSKQDSLKRLFNFIDDHLLFSKFLPKGTISFSNLKYKDGSSELEPRSKLIENLRHLFPKVQGLPPHDVLLNWLLFGERSKKSKLTDFLGGNKISIRPDPSELLAIDYRISNLDVADFENKGLKISEAQLDKLRKDVSYVILDFIFDNPFETAYISEQTSGGILVGRFYFIPEYMALRSIYFAIAEAEGSEYVSFNTIRDVLIMKFRLTHYLTHGIGIGENLEKIEKKLKTLGLKNFKDIIAQLKLYRDISIERSDYLSSLIGPKTYFQGNVHTYIEGEFGLDFISEKSVSLVVGSREIEINGVKEQLHPNFRYDGYAELTKAFKDYLGLDNKWVGLAFEAHGSWHSDKDQFLSRWPDRTESDWLRRQELDQLKRDVSKEGNIILLEIWEQCDEKIWLDKIIEQIFEQTGLKISEDKINSLKYYLGKKQQ